MILLDLTAVSSEGMLIGIQKSNNMYTYLYWDRDILFKWSEYHTQIAGNYEDISGIGPNMLVEWEE